MANTINYIFCYILNKHKWGAWGKPVGNPDALYQVRKCKYCIAQDYRESRR